LAASPPLAFNLGAAFFNAERGSVQRHPWFVLSDADEEARLVIANTSSKAAEGDLDPCILRKGEHVSAMARDGYLRCEKAKITTLIHLSQALEQKLISMATPLADSIVQRFQGALSTSKMTPGAVRAFLAKQGHPK
jgi:hypothetical protein